MYIFLTILIVLAAIFLVFIVVIQNSKGGGLAAGFASSNQIMGVRKTTDFLEKMTWWLAGIIAFLSIFSTHFLKSSVETPAAKYEQQLQKEASSPVTPVTATPDFGNEAAKQTAPATQEQTAPATQEQSAPAEPTKE